jgi:hypothetical protein
MKNSLDVTAVTDEGRVTANSIEDHTTCSGASTDSCSLNCASNSTCMTTVGPSGSVSFSGNATCHITCTGSYVRTPQRQAADQPA